MRPFSSVTSSTRKVSILLTARHQPEGTLLPPLDITSTITYQTVQLSRRDSVSIVGILDLDVEKQEPLKATLRVNGTSLLYKKPSSTSSTTFFANRFHVSHYGGCAILLNKDTFFSDIKVSSFYLYDTRACEKYKNSEGESGWVMQGVVSKAAFRRKPRYGQQTFTVMSLHINNNFAKKRDIRKKLLLTLRAIMQDEHVDLVACDFDGAAWRQSSGNSLQPTGTLRGGICRHGLSNATRPPWSCSW